MGDEKMEKMKFSKIKQPFVCTIITDKNPTDCRRTIWHSDYDGTDAYQWHLMTLEGKYLNEAELRPVYECTLKPILASYYRWDYEKHLDLEEEKRIALLLEAFRWGANGIDLEADAFDPVPGPPEWSEAAREYSLNPHSRPREWTTNPAAVERQKRVIDQVHKLDGEVLLSCHSRVQLSIDQIISMGLEMERRGADIVKIVRVDTSFDDLLITLKATLELKKALKVPFIMGSHGQHSKIGRVVCPMLGSMLAWCTQPLSPGGYPLQPPIKAQKSAWENIDWGITQPPEKQVWL
jgi:3-dehydroquinate dehydratase